MTNNNKLPLRIIDSKNGEECSLNYLHQEQGVTKHALLERLHKLPDYKNYIDTKHRSGRKYYYIFGKGLHVIRAKGSNKNHQRYRTTSALTPSEYKNLAIRVSSANKDLSASNSELASLNQSYKIDAIHAKASASVLSTKYHDKLAEFNDTKQDKLYLKKMLKSALALKQSASKSINNKMLDKSRAPSANSTEKQLAHNSHRNLEYRKQPSKESDESGINKIKRVFHKIF